jgi:hypothetical protein
VVRKKGLSGGVRINVSALFRSCHHILLLTYTDRDALKPNSVTSSLNSGDLHHDPSPSNTELTLGEQARRIQVPLIFNGELYELNTILRHSQASPAAGPQQQHS